MSANQIAFVVDGEWLTNICRQLWADEGNPDKALDLLDAAFPDMTQTDKLAVLVGEKKLVGNSNEGIELIEDNTAVSSFGNPLDLSSLIHKQQQSIKRSREHELMARQMASSTTAFVTSPKGLVEIPLCCAARHANGGYWYLKEGIDLEQIPHRVCETLYADKILSNPLEREKDQQRRVATRASREINHTDGWLSPQGKFYRCGWMEHISLADALGYTEKQLEELGWIKISNNRAIPSEKPPSQAQINALFDWKKELPYWVEDK